MARPLAIQRVPEACWISYQRRAVRVMPHECLMLMEAMEQDIVAGRLRISIASRARRLSRTSATSSSSTAPLWPTALQLPQMKSATASPLFSPHSGYQLAVCPAGFDPACPVVVLIGGVRIVVSQQVVCNTDPVRRENGPSRYRGVTCVVQGDAEAEATRDASAENPADGVITEPRP